MRINSLLIQNFRAIKKIELNDLGDMIVIAGSNGCGKTQIYNAIRLLKSTYGGYQQNEYQQWWGEFQINLNRPGKEIYSIFRDKKQPILISATFKLAPTERDFLEARAESQIRTKIWQELVPGSEHTSFTTGAAFAQAQRVHGTTVENRVKAELVVARKLLTIAELKGELVIYPDLNSEINENLALELLFSTYEPDYLGVIDYHSAQRTYIASNLAASI